MKGYNVSGKAKTLRHPKKLCFSVFGSLLTIYPDTQTDGLYGYNRQCTLYNSERNQNKHNSTCNIGQKMICTFMQRQGINKVILCSFVPLNKSKQILRSNIVTERSTLDTSLN